MQEILVKYFKTIFYGQRDHHHKLSLDEYAENQGTFKEVCKSGTIQGLRSYDLLENDKYADIIKSIKEFFESQDKEDYEVGMEELKNCETKITPHKSSF